MGLHGPAALNLTRRAPRNMDFGQLQETFLVVAVTTILVIRTQLWLTNYPQLGGHGLHIAHLLWGGMFMVIAIGILVTFLGRSPRRVAAIVGGVGFGFFIDELGKFITADNNYFFKPAAALIYLIFIGLFLLTRAFQRERGLSSAERLSNAIDLAARRRPGAWTPPVARERSPCWTRPTRRTRSSSRPAVCWRRSMRRPHGGGPASRAGPRPCGRHTSSSSSAAGSGRSWRWPSPCGRRRR